MAVIAFCLLALPDADGSEATFAAAFLALLACSVAGAFLYDGTLAGSLHCAFVGLAALCACGVVALLNDGPVGGAVMVGLFGGLLAFATFDPVWNEPGEAQEDNESGRQLS